MVTDLLVKLLPHIARRVYFYEQELVGSRLMAVIEHSGRTK